MTAQDYLVTFPYGATSPPYGTPALPYHRGDDRAMPVSTPVLVNGVQIGLSGNTGLSTGSHLHIGHFIGGRDINPNGQGFTVNGGIVTEVSSDSINGKFVRVQDADGSSWVYLHLSQQTVTVGQALQGGDMPTLGDENNLNDLCVGMMGVELKDRPAVRGLIGTDIDTCIRTIFNYPEAKAFRDKASAPSDATVLKPGNYKVQ